MNIYSTEKEIINKLFNFLIKTHIVGNSLLFFLKKNKKLWDYFILQSCFTRLLDQIWKEEDEKPPGPAMTPGCITVFIHLVHSQNSGLPNIASAHILHFVVLNQSDNLFLFI